MLGGVAGLYRPDVIDAGLQASEMVPCEMFRSIPQALYAISSYFQSFAYPQGWV